jgi:F-type H+-transporting ATPase subunit delta
VLKAELPDSGQNFLRAVIDNGRLDALPEIAAQFQRLVNSRSGVADAVVNSAFPIDTGAMADLCRCLKSALAANSTLGEPGTLS